MIELGVDLAIVRNEGVSFWFGLILLDQLLEAKLGNSGQHFELRSDRLHQSSVGLQQAVELLVGKSVNKKISSSSGALLGLKGISNGSSKYPYLDDDLHELRKLL